MAVVAMATTSVGLGIGVTPASAHALLTSTDPQGGAALATPPTRVVLSFSESIRVSGDSIRVLDRAGNRVDLGHAQGGARASQAMVVLRAGLPVGTYVASWRVISADSHPVSGAFAFGVGGPPDAGAARAEGTTSGSAVVGFLFGAARFAGYVGVGVLLGACLFLVLLWPAGLRAAGSGRLLAAAWGLAVAASAAQLLLQGLYTSGSGLGGIVHWSHLSTTLDERFGHLLLIRLLALMLAAPLLRQAARMGRPDLWRRGELAALGLAVAVSLAAIGHGGVGDLVGLSVVSLTVHVLAMSVWIGGLAVIVVLLRTASAAEIGAVLPRWSRLAIGAVVAIVVSGLVQSWREIGSFAAVIDTGYGRMVLYKVWFVLGMLGVAALARQWVRRHYGSARVHPVGAAAGIEATGPDATSNAGPDAGAEGGVDGGPGRLGGLPGAAALAGLRRGIVAELALAGVVLGLTATLVNMVPARTSYAPPFHGSAFAGPMTVKVRIAPTRIGAESIDVYAYAPTGKPQRLVAAQAQLSLPARSLGPFTVPLDLAETGHVRSDDLQVPLSGSWQLRLSLRLNDFDEYATTLVYTVR
ncbi:copper resistance CopC/CopD family protein [Frankia sp. R82]|uniref:copper resistance CopC/CopD family protein n=1 Tax=Frankia sp. R82 TaxID=2950553 RepID=UPI0020439798|nr:copper resistance protein CopC [Frankia sp. R82]MCM3882995.1 copper resistance protein CopC/CopD [Frankia sp. R82]